MAINQYFDAFPYLRDYLIYMETIKGRSPKTVQEYYSDLRTFFRFMIVFRSNDHSALSDPEKLSEVSITNITLDFIRTIRLSDLYEFLHYVMRERSNNASSRARKTSALRGFFKYLTTNQRLLDENPALNLETPSIKKSLPKYLTLDQSLDLLNSVDDDDGANQQRDYCILTLFLNCGMRLAELCGINTSDIRDNTIKLLGKGNKERSIYLNQACLDAIEAYLTVRSTQFPHPKDKNALFLSRNGNRISRRRVQQIVEGFLTKSGLGKMGYSTHKLRHTAATLMYQYGEVDIRVLQDILGHANLGTTQIYTHVSDQQMERAADSNPLSSIKIKK